MEQILAVAGGITGIAAAAVIVWKVITWMRRLVESERCQLRSLMLRTYYNHHATKQVRQYEYENFEKSYAAYKALNGNSFIDKIYEEVHEWEIVT